jgi:hypothetical protein
MRTRDRRKERRPLTDQAGYSRCSQNPERVLDFCDGTAGTKTAIDRTVGNPEVSGGCLQKRSGND